MNVVVLGSCVSVWKWNENVSPHNATATDVHQPQYKKHCMHFNPTYSSLSHMTGGLRLTVHLVAVVTAPWWRGSVGGVGRDQLKVEGESCAAAALSSVRRWAVLIQATRARTSCVLQWRAVGFVQTKKTQDWEKGIAGICPPTGWLQGQEKWRACRPVTSQVYTASGEKGGVCIRYAWQITWRGWRWKCL